MLKRLAALAIVLLLCGGWSHGRGPLTYFVSASGSDSNNGLSASLPWQTIAKVNGSKFNSGDTISFHGGDTFSGGVVITDSIAPSNLTVNSYGAGQATISSGNSNGCVYATSFHGITVNNLICVGGGDLTNQNFGILVENNFVSNNTKIAGPTITNNTISGYGYDCIALWAANGANGFASPGANNGFINSKISNNSAHDCAGVVSSPAGVSSACVFVFAGNNTSGGTDVTSIINTTISGNTVFNCLGQNTVCNGGGITILGTTLTTLTGNLIHDTGLAGGVGGCGPVGVGFFFNNSATVSSNEIYNTSTTGHSGFDGEQINLSGTPNSLVEYNYLHGTASGTGYILIDDAAGLPTNDIYRFNTVENTSSIPSAHFSSGSSNFNGLELYNNTFYQGGAANVFDGGCGTSGTLTVNFSNNIFYFPNGGRSFNFAGAPCTALVFTITGNDYFYASGTFSAQVSGTTYTSLAAFQTAGFEGGGSPVGTTANPNLTGTVGSGGNCLQNSPFTTPCPNAYTLSAASPAGKGNGLNLNSLYSFNVGTQDLYGNAITNTTLPIGAAANR